MFNLRPSYRIMLLVLNAYFSALAVRKRGEDLMRLQKYAVLVLVVIAMIPEIQAQQISRLHKILKTGVIRVGTTGDFNPMSLRDPATNSYKGFDIDVTKELAKDLGVKIKFVPTEWKTIVNGIVADKYDITTSASITPTRIRTVGFSEPYFHVGTVPLTLKKNCSKFNGWDRINKDDVIIAVTLGTSQEQQVKRFFPNAKIRAIEAPARDYQEVLVGRAMISVTSNIEAWKLVRTYPELAVVAVDKPISPADLAFMVAQNDLIWINFLNHWIKIKNNLGFFEELEKKWIITNE
jgi:cyclohexadienyl dehydratase